MSDGNPFVQTVMSGFRDLWWPWLWCGCHRV